EMSLGLKWAVTPSLTVEGTYNPDFSQVESDAAQIDVNNTFALFYPERRPFFQEGSDLFRTWHNVVYTRAINDPVAATKIIGRWKRYTLAYLGAVDENSLLVIPFEEESRYVAVDRNLSNTMRFKRTFGENSYVGAIASDRRLEKDGSGSVLGIDGVFRMFNNYSFEWQVLKSFTTEPNDTSLTSEYNELYFNDGKKTASFDGESFSGDAIYASFERNARHWNVDFDFWQTSPTFRADNGFVNQNNNRKTFFWTGYTFYFNSGWLERFHPNMHAARIWNFDGTVKDEWFSPALNFNLKAQTSLSVQYLFNSENFKNTSLKNINRWRFNLNSNFSEMLRAGVFLQTGRYVANRNDDESPPVRGKGTDVNLWATFKPMLRLIIQPEFSFAEMYRLDNNKKEYSGYILRVRGNYQFTREMFLRLIVQYNDFDNDISIEPLLSYKINPFTVFYVGSRQDYLDYSGSVGWKQTSRQYFLKFQYLFQI
ncbi:MAG: hypothetical protein KAR38_04405, partial [Calditrichia bacterium]|nr:hypothetical protein [Calditrichia bacterium]